MPGSYEFQCPNNHKFQSSAKIRSYCPECGERARRNYGANGGPAETGALPETPPDSTEHPAPEISGEEKEGTEKPSGEGTPVTPTPPQPTRKGHTRVVTVKPTPKTPPGKVPLKPGTPKRQQPGKKPVKAPVIQQRVVTNKEKKVTHDRAAAGGNKKHTVWGDVKRNFFG